MEVNSPLANFIIEYCFDILTRDYTRLDELTRAVIASSCAFDSPRQINEYLATTNFKTDLNSKNDQYTKMTKHKYKHVRDILLLKLNQEEE